MKLTIKELLEKDKKLKERLTKLWKFALGKDFMKLFSISQIQCPDTDRGN